LGGEDRIDLRTSQPLTILAVSVYYRAMLLRKRFVWSRPGDVAGGTGKSVRISRVSA